MSNQVVFIFLALTAGIMIPFQSALNTGLGKSLQSPYFSALTVFIVATIALFVFIFVTGQTIPSTYQFVSTSWWNYLGGILGGTYILLIILCAPKLGIGNVTVLVLLGQILSAVLIDQFGLFQAPLHTLNWQRLVGVVLVIGGVYLVKKF